jgi:hypothetical protein
MSHLRPLLACALAAGFLGCGDDPAPGTIRAGDSLVYEGRQSVQCGSRGLTPGQSAQRLIEGGIDVIASNCGVMTGIFYAAVCGEATGEILIHEIRSVNLPDAEQRGFNPVTELQDPVSGTSWEKVDCQTGVVLPK